MTRPRRRAHVVAWIVLAPLAAALLTLSLLTAPGPNGPPAPAPTPGGMRP